jgi:hypothetical protein
MPDDALPPANPTERARQKRSLLLACGLLALVGVAVLVLPIDQIPYPIRILIAAGDVIAAAVLWLVARQKFDGK